jgi:hypothetical protein
MLQARIGAARDSTNHHEPGKETSKFQSGSHHAGVVSSTATIAEIQIQYYRHGLVRHSNSPESPTFDTSTDPSPLVFPEAAY